MDTQSPRLDRSSPLSDAVEYAKTRQRVSPRAQRKVAWRLFNWYGSSSPRRYLAEVDSAGVIRAFVCEDGSCARFSYGLFGDVLSEADSTPDSIASKSSLRYKSYAYDAEIGCYFLGGRLYHPGLGRFLAPDAPEFLDAGSAAGPNPYCYCNNDPVTYMDHTGHSAVAILIAVGIGALLGAIGGTTSALISDYRDNGSIDGSIGRRSYLGSIVGSTIGGAALGFAGGAGAAWLGPAIAGTGSAAAAWGGLAASAAVSFAGGFLSYSADKWISGDAWDPRKAFIRGGLTALEGMVAFGAGGVASLVSWEGGKTIRIGKKLINVPETVAQNFVSDIFGNPSGWLLDLIMDYFYG